MTDQEIREICKAYVYNMPTERIREISGMTENELSLFISEHKDIVADIQNHFVNVIKNSEEG